MQQIDRCIFSPLQEFTAALACMHPINSFRHSLTFMCPWAVHWYHVDKTNAILHASGGQAGTSSRAHVSGHHCLHATKLFNPAFPSSRLVTLHMCHC